MGVKVQAYEVCVFFCKGTYIPVGEHAAFGCAGGAAGIQQDEQVIGLCIPLGLTGVQFADIGGLYDRQFDVSEDGKEFFIGDEHACVGVLYHEFQSLRGIGRVQGEVGAAGLDGAERRCHHVFVSAEHDSHNALCRDLGFDVSGKIVG